jgi:hypothetical protein
MRFELKYGYDEQQIPRRASTWGWKHRNADALDILAYRVVVG